jgi:hypothetical protein
MIVEKALAGRSFESLVQAYNDETFEDLEEDQDEVMPAESSQVAPWLKRHGFLSDPVAIERRYQDAYVPIYSRLARVSTQQALEVMDPPARLRDIRVIDGAVVDAIAIQQARNDAEDASALRELALQRR